MKIHNIQGCTAFSLNVDGVEEIDMTHEQRLEVIDAIYEWMKRTADDNLNYILQGLTNECGDYNCIDPEPCECCGDTVDEYVLDLDE
jgi:hypothetical protein